MKKNEPLMDQIEAIDNQFMDDGEERRIEDMPRVHHVTKSRKEFPGIPAGSEYWWWKFAFGPTVRSLKPPRPWQLTRSSFLSEYLRISDETAGSLSSWDGVENLVSELENLRDETQDKLNNMSAESGSTVELLEARVEGLEEWINHIDDVAGNNEGVEFTDDIREELCAGDPGIE